MEKNDMGSGKSGTIAKESTSMEYLLKISRKCKMQMKGDGRKYKTRLRTSKVKKGTKTRGIK